MCIRDREKKRPLVPLGLGTAGLCAALVFQAASHTAGRLTVSVLDVGCLLYTSVLHPDGLQRRPVQGHRPQSAGVQLPRLRGGAQGS